jgi:hypothetical protein
MRDGKIVAAGARVTIPAGARQIDATGKWVTPGVFAGFTRLGLSEVDAVNGTNDKSGGKSGFSAAIDVAPAIDPFRSPFAVNRAAGVTRAVVAPEAANNIFAGQGAIADLGADGNPVTKARAFQFAELRLRVEAERERICTSAPCCVRPKIMLLDVAHLMTIC